VRTLVLDASIAIKWYFPEVHSDAALALISTETRWVVPDLFYAEVGNVLWKKVDRGETTVTVALNAMESLLSLDIDVRAARPLVKSALEVAHRFRCTVYDALYLATAIEEGCPFVTADRKFYDVMAQTALEEHLLWIEDA
jgi:predicted nucleic acid-binding protein